MSSRKAVAAKSFAAKPLAAKPLTARKAVPKLPAGGAMSDEAQHLAAEIKSALALGQIDVLAPEAMQNLMASLCRLYSAQAEAGAEHPFLGAHSEVTATDAMVVASGLLKAVNLAVFELGMWQSWTGR
jgi:hypothetical protein